MELSIMDTSIGERIKNRRKELNITQIQIKEATGILTGESPKSEGDVLSNIEKDFLKGFRELPEEEKNELIGILKMKLHKIQSARETKSSQSTDTEKNNKAG